MTVARDGTATGTRFALGAKAMATNRDPSDVMGVALREFASKSEHKNPIGELVAGLNPQPSGESELPFNPPLKGEMELPFNPAPFFPRPTGGEPAPPPAEIDLLVPRYAGEEKRWTNLALGAVKILTDATPELVRDAVNTVRGAPSLSGGTGIPAAELMEHLVQKVKVSDVLAELAEGWTAATRTNFADVFKMDPARKDIMDAIVSIAILNNPTLEMTLRGENTPTPSQTDLLENRRVIWQYPPAGTPLNPPYLILVAVESTDPTAANQVVRDILGQLAAYEGYLLPRAAVLKLGRQFILNPNIRRVE